MADWPDEKCGTGKNSVSFPGWSNQTVESIPRIVAVKPLERAELLVRFDNGVEKSYDCQPLLGLPQFRLLTTPAFFRAVQVDPGGYGISWNDNMDLSGYELWVRGTPSIKEPTGG
jgi:hypothetical protein